VAVFSSILIVFISSADMRGKQGRISGFHGCGLWSPLIEPVAGRTRSVWHVSGSPARTGGLKCDGCEEKGKVIKKETVVPVVDAGKVEINANFV
jgi:hypothetical protein